MKVSVKLLIVAFTVLAGAAPLSFHASADEYEAAGTLCDPINTYAARSEERLRKFNGEIRNISSIVDETVGVMCPILNDPSGAFQDFYVGVRNLGTAEVAISCTLIEVFEDGTKIETNRSVPVPAGAAAELEWLAMDVTDHTFWHVFCRLPGRTSVTHMHTFDSVI